MDGLVSKEEIGRLISTFLIDIIFTIVVALIVNGVLDFPLFSTQWWGLTLITLYTISVTSFIVYLLMFKRRPVVPEPEQVPAFTKQVTTARENFCAVSSKPLALWESPTFIFYLVVNGVRNLQMYSSEKGCVISVSSKTEDKNDFYDEGFRIADQLAKGDSPDYFFGLRFLVYSEQVYKEKTTFIERLLELHDIFRIHCIPIEKKSFYLNYPRLKERR